MIPRRSFREIVTGSGVIAALGDSGFRTQLPSVSAEEVALEPRIACFHPEIEPLVRLIEEMPRNRVLEEVARRVKHGLNYRELVPALLLAGVRGRLDDGRRRVYALVFAYRSSTGAGKFAGQRGDRNRCNNH